MAFHIDIALTDSGFRKYGESFARFREYGCEASFIEIVGNMEPIFERWQRKRPDGLVTQELELLTDRILELDIPTVVLCRDVAHSSAIVVNPENFQIGREAVRFFLNRGFHQFAFVGDHRSYSVERREGFMEELDTRGLEPAAEYLVEGTGVNYWEYSNLLGADIGKWLVGLPKPAAVFAANDTIGRLVCDASRLSGIFVPQSLAVLGVDNYSPMCSLATPSLSSVDIPMRTMGECAALSLIDFLHGRRKLGEVISVPPLGVVTRESTDIQAIVDPDLRRALQWIQKNLSVPVSVGVLCDELLINRRQLERLFRKNLNCAPSEYIIQQRFERAKRLLNETRHSIEGISESCGFCDAAYFSNQFRRRFGLSPSQYRKQFDPQLKS